MPKQSDGFFAASKMKHYHTKPSVHCSSFASKPETVVLAVLYVHACTLATDCSYGITHYYVIATDHVYAKSAELVHMKKSRSLARLADSLLCPVMGQSSYWAYC